MLCVVIPLPHGQSFLLVCDNFLTTFRLLSDGFCFNWSIKMCELWKAELSSSMLAFQQMATPPLTATCIFIGQLQRKPLESCRKVVTN